MGNSNAGMGLSGALSDPKEAGTALLKQGKFDEAAAVLREAVALDNNDEIAWRLLGGALASKGDSAGAIQAFQNAARLLPMAARSHYNLGLAFQSAGRTPEAKASFERALSLDPGHEQARTRLSEVAQQLGQRAPAAPAAPAEGHTNIGGGNSTGLASISSPSYQAQSQTQTPASEGHSNIGGGNSVGLLSIGSHRDSPASAGGHSNITGGSTIGLSSVGAAASAPQDTGHTNIGGGNTSMLGSVSAGGSAARPAPSSTPPPSSAPPMSAPPSSYPSSAPPSSVSPAGYIPTPVLGQSYSQNLANTSGMQGDVPPGVAKPFNWGAFWFSWIWLFNMRAKPYGWGMLVFSIVSNSISRNTNNSAVSIVLSLLHLGIAIALGVMGNKIAWQHRTFVDEEDFHACQRTWAYWALGMFIFSIAITVLLVVILGAAIFASIGGRGGAGGAVN